MDSTPGTGWQTFRERFAKLDEIPSQRGGCSIAEKTRWRIPQLPKFTFHAREFRPQIILRMSYSGECAIRLAIAIQLCKR
jgi:hypothetical protein